MDSSNVCILCENKFDQSQIGSLECRVHPLPFNYSSRGDQYNVNHYDCCGASIFQRDIIHYEVTKPIGCHRIDHVSSLKELQDILQKPFICLLTEETKKINSYKQNKSDVEQHLISILSKERLEYEFIFKLPFQKEYVIDINQEHSKLIGKNKNTEHDKPQLYIYSNEEWDHYSNKIKNKKDFIPFYIIRRMDYKIDSEKKKEINNRLSCNS